MKKLLLFILLSLLVGRSSLGQVDTSFESNVDAYVKPYLDMNAWSGVILISQDGVPIFKKAYGLADREWQVKNTTDTKFRIASISKVFTEVAILQLVENGKISPEDKLTEYISDYPRGNEITIRQLLEHRSGIPHLNSFPDYSDLIKNEYQLNEIIDLFKYKALDFEPGERYSYSNSGYVLLAFIIEEVSELSFEDYLDKELFKKLKLDNTGIDQSDRILAKRARGYMFDNTGTLVNAEYVNMSIKIGGGSLYSTADDLNNFTHQLLNKKILSTTLDLLPNFSENNGEELFSANGRVQGFCHQITHRTEEGISIIVLGNHYSNIALPISDDIYKIYSGSPYKNPVNYFAQQKKISKEDLIKYEGTYDFGFGPVGTVKVKDSYLTYLPPGRDKADRLIALGEHLFFYPQSWVLLKFRNNKGEEYDTLDWIMGDNSYPAVRIN